MLQLGEVGDEVEVVYGRRHLHCQGRLFFFKTLVHPTLRSIEVSRYCNMLHEIQAILDDLPGLVTWSCGFLVDYLNDEDEEWT